MTAPDPTTVDLLVERIASDARWRVRPPGGQPTVAEGLTVPADLARFYALAGGAELFRSSDYAMNIVDADAVRPTNIEIVGELVEEDLSSTWHTIGRASGTELISIDLHPLRLLSRSPNSYNVCISRQRSGGTG